ncbi:hypothetical protein BGW41_008085 [Actinomortierella wolfii]|nr:hypothetical protein BGW41_008085 [Actinomortierella wolfii]
MAVSFPRAQGGPWTNSHTKGVHSWIGDRGKEFPCGGYKKGPVTKLKAGQVINVEFWNYDRGDWTKFPPKSGTDQSRHGGGACEFSLSFDRGKSWRVIGQYTKTCPDIFYKWPVQIPKNVPSCKDSNRCLFSWSWVAHKTKQFYHHCANVEIQGNPNVKRRIPPLKMTVVDVTQLGQKRDTTAIGDGKEGKSSGPNSTEKKRNLSGYYAAGGGVEKNGGIDLLLMRNGRHVKRSDVEDENEDDFVAEAVDVPEFRTREDRMMKKRVVDYNTVKIYV